MVKKNNELKDAIDSSEKKTLGEEDFKKKLSRDVSEILVQISETRKDIQSAVTPQFIEMSPQVKDLIELSIEIWRLEKRLTKILPDLEDNQKETIINSIQKLKRYLDKNDIELIDHTNHKFNEGRNLDILYVKKDPSISEPIIEETMEPTVMYRGQMKKR